MIRKSQRARRVTVAVCAVMGIAGLSRGGNVSWVNPTGGDWNDPANWSSFPNLPGSGDDVFIPGNAGAYSVTLSSGTQSIGSLSTDEVVNLNGGGTLNVAGDLTDVGGSQGFLVNGGSLFVRGNMSGLNLSSGAATIDGTAGAVSLGLGTLANATVQQLAVQGLESNGSFAHIGTLSAVTLNNPLNIAGSVVTVMNGITVLGRVNLQDQPTAFASFDFVGSQTIGGTGEIHGFGFGIDGQGNPASVTIGPGILVMGEAQGTIGSVNSPGGGVTPKESLIVAGAIMATNDGNTFGALDRFSIGVPMTLTSTGKLSAEFDSSIHITYTFNWSAGQIVGSGLLYVDGGLTISGNPRMTENATLDVVPAGQMSGVGRPVSIGFALTPGSTLDMSGGRLIVDAANGQSSYASIRALVADGYNGGSWDGASGIVSTGANADPLRGRAVGVATASDMGTTIIRITEPGGLIDFVGTVSPDATEVLYTFYGDSNLDGFVDRDDWRDLNNFIMGLNGQRSGWAGGDFNYDGITDIAGDFPLYLNGYLVSHNFTGGTRTPDSLIQAIQNSEQLTSDQKAQMLALIPEPGSVGIIGCCFLGAVVRRRRR